ncbi:unnamed protein product [Pichia kudriavzevii]
MEDSSNTHSKIKFENLSSKDVLPDYYVLLRHIIKYLVSKFRFTSRKVQQKIIRDSSANNQNSSELSEHCCVIGPNSYLQDC